MCAPEIHKTESFLRDSRHMNRIGILVMPRCVANPAGFRFSDGMAVPHGAFLEVEARRIRHVPVDLSCRSRLRASIVRCPRYLRACEMSTALSTSGASSSTMTAR
ncbi:hypothetical protein B0H13DRAFT_2314883 [Mycena leptocephala]|nr:hypothetical protein B0H13DRAFT_2314883 [Mycena leptocephala]